MINKESFRFYTSSILIEITGKKARHLKEFVNILKGIDESSIFFHVHHALREYSFAAGQYTNDFARWVGEALEEGTLAEKLAAINVRDFTDINSLREKLVEIVEDHLKSSIEIRKAAPGREFYFLRSIEMIAPTPYQVSTLKEFTSALDRVGMRSIYFHFFDARLRLGRKTNDFSNWIQYSLGEEEKARKINNLDPYFMTMDQLKYRIIAICLGKEEKLK